MIDFEKIKAEYDDIKASNELKGSVCKMIKKERKREVLKVIAATAACAVVASVGTVNVSPALAQAVSDVPIVGSVVRVVTLGRYENKDGGYEAKVVTPKLTGLLDKELEQKLNSEFKENAAAIIEAYEKDAEELKKEFPGEEVHMSVQSDYVVRCDNDKILALDVYLFNASGSSSTVHTFYNIDKQTGKLITLSGLFKEDADYVNVLSEYIKTEMKRINDEEDGLFWIDGEQEEFEGFKDIKPEQGFYINDKGNIVICFDKYEVAAGAQGCPEFEIPESVIAGIVK